MFGIDYIVVPVDFSRSSRAALSLAKSLADKDTRVEMIHVVDRWPRFMEDVLFPYAPLGEDAIEIEAELVGAAHEALGDYHNLNGEKNSVEGPIVAFGELKPTLTDHIKATGSQLVIAGAFGESGVAPDSLGSVAERLIRSSGRATLLVRGIDAHPTIKKILLALDLTEGSNRVVEVAVGLAQRSGAELEIIHVVPDPLADDQSQVLASALGFDRGKVASKARHRVEALFDRLIRDLEPAYGEHVEVAQLLAKRRVTMGDPAAEIVAYAQKTGADLVVVGSQNPARADSAYLGRVAATVARRSPTHVVVVPIPSLSRLSDDG